MESPINYGELPDPRVDAARFRIELIRNMFRLLSDTPPPAARQNRNHRDDRNGGDSRTLGDSMSNPANKRGTQNRTS